MTVEVDGSARRGRWGVVLAVLALPAIVVVVVAVLIVSQSVVAAANDAAARDIETQLRDAPLPGDAEVLDSTSLAGKLSGNGNGMQYLGAILIRSDQTASELQEFYDAQAVAEDLWVEVTTGDGLSGLHRTPGFLGGPAEPGTYIVFSWGDGPGEPFESFDLRGH